jgi:hypothetical protein
VRLLAFAGARQGLGHCILRRENSPIAEIGTRWKLRSDESETTLR